MSKDECTTDSIPSPPRDEENIFTKDKDKQKAKVTNSDDEEPGDKFRDTPPRQSQTFVPMIFVAHSPGVHIGHNYTFYGKNEKTKNNVTVHETEKIRLIKRSEEKVTSNDIEIISLHMCNGWEETARKLGYSNPQIEQFLERYPKNTKEAIYKLLLDWIQNKPFEATVGKLANTLWETRHYETVEQWSKRYDEIHK